MRDMCDLSDTKVSDTSDTAATSVGAIERCLQHVEMSAGWSNYEPLLREMLADLAAARDELAMLRGALDTIALAADPVACAEAVSFSDGWQHAMMSAAFLARAARKAQP